MKIHRFSLALGLLSLISIAGPASALSKDLLGVAPEDEKYFKSEIIKCKDGSKKFTKTQLNDDFCDCPDGTDEPGTSACPGGKFYCRNAGHTPLILFSSRVNDGICDCCDGSDEYAGMVKCSNTCWEAGKVARDKLARKITTYQEGVAIRKQEVEQAKQGIAKEEAELSRLKHKEKLLKGLVQQLKERKEQIEKVEEKERLEKEKEEERKNEAEEKADVKKKQSVETPHHDTIGLVEDTPLDQDVTEVNDDSIVEVENDDNAGNEETPIHGVAQEKDGSDNTEGLSREELGRLVASRWTGENTEQQTKEVDAAKEDAHEGDKVTSDRKHEEDYDGDDSEIDEENQNYEDDAEDGNMDDKFEVEDHEDSSAYGNMDDNFEAEDREDSSATNKFDSQDQTKFSDIARSSGSSWLDKIQQTVRNILQAVNLFQTPVDKSDAARIRKEYDDSSSKLSKIQSRISSLTEKLKHDFGAEKEFYSFYEHCFENEQSMSTKSAHLNKLHRWKATVQLDWGSGRSLKTRTE